MQKSNYYSYFDHAINKIMNPQLINDLRNFFARQPVLKAFVFGSFARDEQTAESDLDLLIELDPEVPVGLEYVQMYLDLKDLTGFEIDLVTEKSLSPYVRPRVEKEKVLVYEKQAG